MVELFIPLLVLEAAYEMLEALGLTRSASWNSEKLGVVVLQEAETVEEWLLLLVMLRGEGRFKPPRILPEVAEEEEFCLEKPPKGEGEEGVEGVEGEFEETPSSFLALKTTE